MDRGLRQIVATTDVSSTDLGVYTIIGSLMVVGLILIFIAAWLFKATKPEMELLSPLERMGERSWKKLDPAMQRRELDQLRPVGARPIERSTQIPSIDEDFDKPVPDIPNFDDLTSMQAADVRRQIASKAREDATTALEVDAETIEATDELDGDDTSETVSPDGTSVTDTPSHGLPAIDDADAVTSSDDEI